MIHFGYREYDPVIGRFISPDPLGYDGGDVDVYGYCLDDPINFVDRNGLFSNGLCGAFGSGKTDTRAQSSLGANRSTSKETNNNSSKKGSSHSYGRNGTIGAFGSGDSSIRAHSTLGFNGNRTIGKNNDQSNNSSAKSSVQQAREMEKRAAEIAQKEFQAEQAKLAETKARRDRTIAAAKEREDKMRQMVSIGAIELKNNPASPLTDTVDPNKQAKPKTGMPGKTQGGVDSKPSRSDAATSELGGYTAYSGYAGPSFAEYVGKDFDLGGTRFTAKNTLGESVSKKADRERKAREAQERRDKNQLIGIGKFAVRRSLLTQPIDKAQQDKESGTWNGMLRTARGIYDAATGGYYATGEAVSKAGEAFTSDPRIYGTTLAAAALPGVIAGGILAGGELAT
ncbi:hypothetical protein FMS18_19990, partial [Desulfovibrio sp. JC022]|nr:hypothetical protein [Desulfovibrio sp. JC022]